VRHYHPRAHSQRTTLPPLAHQVHASQGHTSATQAAARRPYPITRPIETAAGSTMTRALTTRCSSCPLIQYQGRRQAHGVPLLVDQGRSAHARALSDKAATPNDSPLCRREIQDLDKRTVRDRPTAPRKGAVLHAARVPSRSDERRCARRLGPVLRPRA